MTTHDLDPGSWVSLMVTTRRPSEPDAADRMEVVVQGELADGGAEDWPIIMQLRGRQPGRYAQAVMTAAVQARYEEMLWAQLRGRINMEEEMAASVILDLREKRPAISDGWTFPLRFAPIYGHGTRKGLVNVSYRGAEFSQWTVGDTLGHCMAVLEASATAPLDAAYYTYLRDTIGLDKPRASTMVHALGAEYPAEEAPGKAQA